MLTDFGLDFKSQSICIRLKQILGASAPSNGRQNFPSEI